MDIRDCAHAGSWYTSDKEKLSGQLTSWMNIAECSHSPACAIIVPHAGYRYSGLYAAYGFKQIVPGNVQRVFIIGPSHHLYIADECALSSVTSFQTPLGVVNVDFDVYKNLRRTGRFMTLTKSQDEAEHSIEMQLPFILEILKDQSVPFSIVPVLTGHLSFEQEVFYGKLFAPYLCDKTNVFVVSSDFCHWGKRFRYQFYDEADGEIWQSIEKLDHRGMDIIESLNHESFRQYLQTYQNTICGRRGIGILLAAVETSRQSADINFELKFLRYAQSSKCKNREDSSVSYAAASLVIK